MTEPTTIVEAVGAIVVKLGSLLGSFTSGPLIWVVALGITGAVVGMAGSLLGARRRGRRR